MTELNDNIKRIDRIVHSIFDTDNEVTPITVSEIFLHNYGQSVPEGEGLLVRILELMKEDVMKIPPDCTTRETIVNLYSVASLIMISRCVPKETQIEMLPKIDKLWKTFCKSFHNVIEKQNSDKMETGINISQE